MNVASSHSKKLSKRTWEAVLDALFPPRCAGCDGWSRAVFCEACTPLLSPVLAPLCGTCGEPFDPLAFSASLCSRCRDRTPQYVAARAAYRFNGPVREGVHKLKYGEKAALAPRLAPLLAHLFQTDAALRDFGPQWIVPIPLHPHRLRKRGFNQSALLANELGLLLEIPVADLLERTRDTTAQVDLKRADRAKNMKGAFAVKPDAFAKARAKGTRILVLDDVLTTGATLDEAARVLKKAGASEIRGITLARSTHF